MQIVDFTVAYIEPAAQLARQNYEEERGHVPALPPVDLLPDLREFAENRLGVAAFCGGELVGFLCCYKPWDRHFGLTKGTFSPIHAHGAVKNDRAKIYDRLYQAASEKWVSNGILSHAVGLYAHDGEAIDSFFQNGFGNRTIDAIRETAPLKAVPSGYEFRKARTDEAQQLAALNDGLVAHLRTPPMFMPFFDQINPDDIAQWMLEEHHGYFAAYDQEKMIAYIKLQPTGETFACDDPSMMNISGAYALPEYRGGMYAGLLSWTVDRLREQGYTRLGVDFESFNPTARSFWLKHFTAYTHGVVRRIDERIGSGRI